MPLIDHEGVIFLSARHWRYEAISILCRADVQVRLLSEIASFLARAGRIKKTR
jgi:hypothetical protein